MEQRLWFGAPLLAGWVIARPPRIILAAACSIADQREALVAGVLDRGVFAEDSLRRIDLAVGDGGGLWAHDLYALGCGTAPFAIGLAGDNVVWIPVFVVVRHQVVALLAGERHFMRVVEH